MIDILVPIARRVDLVVVGPEQIPWDLRGEVSGYMRGAKQVSDFAHAVGRTTKVTKPLMIYGPDDRVPICIVGDGVTEAAEMEDLALEALGKSEEMVKKTGRGFDFDEAREKAGMVRREDFQEAWHDAFERKSKELKSTWRTRGA